MLSVCGCGGGIEEKDGWMGDGWAKMGYWLIACWEQVAEDLVEGGWLLGVACTCCIRGDCWEVLSLHYKRRECYRFVIQAKMWPKNSWCFYRPSKAYILMPSTQEAVACAGHHCWYIYSSWWPLVRSSTSMEEIHYVGTTFPTNIYGSCVFHCFGRYAYLPTSPLTTTSPSSSKYILLYNQEFISPNYYYSHITNPPDITVLFTFLLGRVWLQALAGKCC